MLDPSVYKTWLDASVQGADAKAFLLENQMDSQLEFYRIGREVNSSRYDGSDTKKPILNSL